MRALRRAAAGMTAPGRRFAGESLAKVPAEHHLAMLANPRVNREIAAAANAAEL